MKPVDIIGAKAIEALRADGWIVVRHDAIRLAQISAENEVIATGRNLRKNPYNSLTN